MKKAAKQNAKLFILAILNILIIAYYILLYFDVIDVFTYSLHSSTAQMRSDGYGYIIGKFAFDYMDIILTFWSAHCSKNILKSANQKRNRILPILLVIITVLRIIVELLTWSSRSK